ncbi:MAG: hypothetical protein HY770_03715 [Chitinivibrionia bacterium]|nr:hypothetical protein [Chitinivibrionia bacterium]
MKRQAIIVIALLGLMALGWLIECGRRHPVGGTPDGLVIHEWGVLVGCQSDSSFFLTSRPEMEGVVREPVIYVHRSNEASLSAQVVFNAGEPTATYPIADVVGDTVRWENVSFTWSSAAPKLIDTSKFAPLPQTIDILNQVDADRLYCGGQTARFLFYEGTINYRNLVTATPDNDNRWVVLHNQASFPVCDVVFSFGPGDGDGPFVPRGLYLANLLPGQIDTLLYDTEVWTDLGALLTATGFTPMEADAFATLWSESIYGFAALGSYGNLFYRLPQSEYDEMLTLTIDPEPAEILRALHILVHIQD